jgi:hypothetical protein
MLATMLRGCLLGAALAAPLLALSACDSASTADDCTLTLSCPPPDASDAGSDADGH